jgi:carbon storage regulator
MLVLSRKVGEKIWIGDHIAITVVRITGGSVRIGIEAPPELPVVREELKNAIQREQDEASGARAGEARHGDRRT